MLTARGWWLLAFALMALVLGVLLARQGASTLLIVALAVTFWIGWEWLQFAIQARVAARDLRATRRLHDDRGTTATLWAGRGARVTLTVRLAGPRKLSFAQFTDRVPLAGALTDGQATWAGPLAPGDEARWSYRLTCPQPGSARFDGIGVRLTDLQGFFYFETFLRDPLLAPILPTLVDVEARQRATKRFNLLPPPGIHRHRRPGSGSELLDLRDYRPGDPPKRIAWKASARRDRLITRELESEVPLRCTLIVDASDSVRLGPPGRHALAGLVSVAAAVTQAAAGNRDLVGLALCDERRARYTAPARTTAHVIALVRQLAQAADLGPATEAADVEPLLTKSWALANAVYPDLLRPSVNSFPGWLAWLRPQPGWTRRRPTLADRVFGSPLGVVALLLAVVALSAAGLLLGWLAIALAIPALAFCGFAVLVATWLAASQLTAKRRRMVVQRKRLGALIGQQYDLPLGAAALILEDDAACSAWLQRFLADHRVPYDVPREDDRGRSLFTRPAKIEVLARALTRAVARGRDNELFVILADLLDFGDDLQPLLSAVRVARARHHQLLVVCPQPDAEGNESKRLDWPADDATPEDLAQFAFRRRRRRAWQHVRRAFGKYGVPVIPARGGDTARAILHRLEQMRAIQGASRL